MKFGFHITINDTLPKSGRVYLCPAAACPYFEFNDDKVIIYDDRGKVIVETNNENEVKIVLPREYLEELLRSMQSP